MFDWIINWYSNWDKETIMRIGIMAALQQEIADLLSLMGPQMQVTRIGQRDYYQGKIGQHDCVVVLARIGKVAASATCVTLIREFQVEQIVFTGLAGGLGASVQVGDIVVATELLQHDFDASPLFPRYEIPLLGCARFSTDHAMSQSLMQAADDYLHQADGLVNDVSDEMMAQFGLAAERFVPGAAEKSAAENAEAENIQGENPLHTIHLHQGLILSGDQFISSHEQADRLSTEHPEALATEMEGAAIAQICYEYEVPFVVLRVISDKANDDASVDFEGFLNHVAKYISSGILLRWLGV